VVRAPPVAADAEAGVGAAAVNMSDRFGLSWRGELAAGILTNLDRIDCLEIIADDYLDDRDGVRALRRLARTRPVTLHSIAIGPAAVVPVESSRVRKLARVIGEVEPENWSEHLAWTRAGGVELGHLAAPIRDQATLESTLENLRRLEKATGALPEIENVASLVDPPGAVMSEAAWLACLLAQCSNGLLLDLENVYANALNFGFDPEGFLDALPLDRVRTVHIAGGKWIGDGNGGRRWLDNHLEPVPVAVYGLLEYLAARAPHPLTVILERDGAFAGMQGLLAELDRGRAAVSTGRSRTPASPPPRAFEPFRPTPSIPIEELAHAFVDRDARAKIPHDPAGMELAAASFARKRARK
jgi:uncharacterized protein